MSAWILLMHRAFYSLLRPAFTSGRFFSKSAKRCSCILKLFCLLIFVPSSKLRNRRCRAYPEHAVAESQSTSAIVELLLTEIEHIIIDAYLFSKVASSHLVLKCLYVTFISIFSSIERLGVVAHSFQFKC